MRAGQLRAEAGPAQAVDRLPVQPLGGLGVAEEGPDAVSRANWAMRAARVYQDSASHSSCATIRLAPARRAKPAVGFEIGAGVQRKNQLDGPGHGRGRSCVSRRQPQRERVEQDVRYSRRTGGGRRGARGLGGRPHAAGKAQVTSPHRDGERLQVGLARQGGIELFQAPGRAEQQPGPVAAAPLLPRDLAAQALHLGGPQRVRRSGLHRNQQPQCRIQRARGVLGARGREQPLRPANGFGCQQRRTFEKGSRRGQAAARLRPAGRALKLPGHVLVGPGRGLRPVPGPAVRIVPRVGDLGQRPVHVLPLEKRRRPVDRRAHKRMTECHPGAELDQPGLGRRHRRLSPDPQQPGGPPHQPRSPAGSAAATSSSRRLWSGSARTRRRKLSSTRPETGAAPANPNPPASSAGVNPLGSSSRAKGFPRVSATIRSRTRASSGPVSTESSSARASSSRRPSITSSGSPARWPDG